ncbi:MAG: aldolase/citrate lyase family protein [Alphaproteobacteria bacterium]
MRPNKVRQKWERGEAASNFWLASDSSVIAEFAAHFGYDSITVDAQHGFSDNSDMLGMIQAMAATSSTPFVRLRWNDPGQIMRALDAGSYGLICPMVNSAEDAEHLVRYARYPPHGERSWGPHRAILYSGDDYRSQIDNTVIVLPMIETKAGYTELDNILDVDGIDGVYVGPSDLSLSLGFEPAADTQEPKVWAAIEDIGKRARAAGKACAIFCGSVSMARRARDIGFNLITLTADLTSMSASAKATLAEFEE